MASSGLEIYESGIPEHDLSHSAPQHYSQQVEKEHHVNHASPQYNALGVGHPSSGKGVKTEQKQRYPLWLVFVVALAAALVVGAAIGGGLGSQLKAHKNSTSGQQQTTTTATKTVTSSPPAATTSGGLLINYAPAQPSSIYSLALDCPGIDGRTYTAGATDQVFAIACGLELVAGDIVSFNAYAFDDCINACANMNYYTGNNTACSKVYFTTELAQFVAYGNCFLKTTDGVSGSGEPRDTIASAELTTT